MPRRLLILLACAGLSACSVFGDVSFGEPSTGLKNVGAAAAYLPLETREFLLLEHWGAGVVVAPNVAVTSAHNANLISQNMILAESRDYDLLFFRTERESPAPLAQPSVGQAVVAYGQGRREDLREASGIVRAVNVRVAPRCRACPEQRAITYDANAGPGFSGGPLVDARTGAVVGLTFGYRDAEQTASGRRMFAYAIDLVLAEMHRLLPAKKAKS